VAGRPDLRGWVMAGTNLARLVGVLVAVSIGTAEAVIVAYVIANAIGSVVQATIAWSLARRRWRGGGGTPAVRVPMRELVRFGFHTSLTTSVAAANSALLPVVLGRVGGPTAVGVFRVAMFPVLVVGTASGPIRLVLLPEQARLSAQGDIGELRGSIRTHMLAGAALGLPFVVAGWFAMPWLLPLVFSDKFASAVLPARILLVSAFLQFAGAWFKTLPAAVGKPQLRSALAVVELVLMLGLIVALGGQGAKGAAIALSVSSVVGTVLAVASINAVLRSAEAAAGATP
jgi:O-antigen/teichoic acid export membrane protein